MNKIELKANIKQVERDKEYYMNQFGLNPKEAYEEIYKRYYYRMIIVKDKVEIEAREKIHNSIKEFKDENKQNAQ